MKNDFNSSLTAGGIVAVTVLAACGLVFFVWTLSSTNNTRHITIDIPTPTDVQPGTPTTDDSYPYASLAQPSPWQLPDTNDEGEKSLYAEMRRWDVQCRALAQYTGKQCKCAMESAMCISAMGSMVDMRPAGLSPFDK